MKSQEESQERKKQAERDAYMNRKQQVPKDQQAVKAAMENTKEKERVHTAQKYIKMSSDSLFSSSSYRG